jgi:C4-dicarboxylate-binding protein DctP
MKRLAVALAVVLALTSVRAARADEPIVLKFSHVVAPDAPKGKAALFFKELAEKYTGGRVKVEVFPNSSLYKDKEELEALQLGSVQLLAPSISKFSPLGVKEFDIFDLPFLLSDEARARQMMASPMMADLNKKLENKGVSPLAYWDNGAHDYTANKPLIMPDDFRGMKMRMVDGEDNVPTNILTQRFYEVQKHLTISHHGRLTYALVTNKTFWNSLPQDVRAQLDRAVKESTDFFNATAAKDNEDAIEKIKASGKTEIHILTDAEKKAWISKLMPVHTEMQSRFGKDFIERIYKASGFTPPQS